MTPELPPGPRAPAALQTIDWIARPTTLLRRSAERYGEPFTLRPLLLDAPLVLVSDPVEVRRIFTAGPDELRAGQSSAILEPFAGQYSILLLDGAQHLRQRRLMLTPFHGDQINRYRDEIAQLAREEVMAWPRDVPFRSLPRMQALTLRVIMRVVFGPGQHQALHDAIRDTLEMTSSFTRLVAMSLLQRDLGPRSPWRTFQRAVSRIDALLHDVIRARRARPPGDDVLSLLLAARHDDGTAPTDVEIRDQLATLLAAGHETTATALAWALERLSRHPQAASRIRDGDEQYLDAVVKEVLRTRPVLSIAARRVVGDWTVGGRQLPRGVHLAACIYLTHHRPDLYPQPHTFRPERFLDAESPAPYAWIPFGGGVRRCLGAAFASMELNEILRAVTRYAQLRPDRPADERTRRSSVILTPARGARVIATVPVPRSHSHA